MWCDKNQKSKIFWTMTWNEPHTHRITTHRLATNKTNMRGEDKSEIGHYVVTAHPSGSVLSAVQCSFLSANSRDVVIAKSTRIEIRQYQPPSSDDVGGNNNVIDTTNSSGAEDDRFPLVLTLPINGRIASLSPIRFTNSSKDCLFFTTESSI